MPEETTDKEILDTLRDEHNILISGCFDVLAGKVVRIGHMGENAREEYVGDTLAALQNTLEKLGVKVNCDLKDTFYRNL